MAFSRRTTRVISAPPWRLGRAISARPPPNPAVGALVVKDGVVLGRGCHAPAAARMRSRGAGAGRGTRARRHALCHAGALRPPRQDPALRRGRGSLGGGARGGRPHRPDPRVAGEGFSRLRDAGIDVETDVLAQEGSRAHRGHILRVTEGRPTVTLKIARTRTASRRATNTTAASPSPARRQPAHPCFTALHDAIMVGIGTALDDDPLMTVRLPGATRNPCAWCSTPGPSAPRSRLVVGARDFPTLVFCGAQADPARRAALEAQGSRSRPVDLVAAASTCAPPWGARRARPYQNFFRRRAARRRRIDRAGPGRRNDPVHRAQTARRKGVEALSARARDILADLGLYRVVEQGLLGADRFIHYERVVFSGSYLGAALSNHSR